MKQVPPLLGRRQLVVTTAAVIIASLAAPFGTAGLGLPARLLFWTLLIGFNTLKWQFWYQRVLPRVGPGWQAAALLVVAGAILLNITLPFEIMLAYALVGQQVAMAWAPTFIVALVISLAVGAAIAVARAPTVAPELAAPVADTVADAPPAAPPAAPSGLALRAGLPDLAGLRTVTAEDHYLRLWLADGRSPLVLYRLGDALLELAAVDGMQVHRGAWVAAAAVRGATRDGRRWRLLIEGGAMVPVSESFLPAVRARGWLARRGDA